jgi:hypothetical protein
MIAAVGVDRRPGSADTRSAARPRTVYSVTAARFPSPAAPTLNAARGTPDRGGGLSGGGLVSHTTSGRRPLGLIPDRRTWSVAAAVDATSGSRFFAGGDLTLFDDDPVPSGIRAWPAR